MWKWKNNSAEAEKPAPPAAPEPPRETLSRDADAPMDTVGSILRALGKNAFDLDSVDANTTRRLFEAWAQHVLLAGPRPGMEEQPPPGEATRRDWGGVQRFVADHRRLEQQFVEGSLSDLREVIWAAIQALQGAFVADQQTDGQVMERLSQLKTVVDERPVEDLKREVLSTVASIATLVHERKVRQQAEMQQLGEKVSNLANQLHEAKRESELDPLTQLHNRRALDEHLAKVISLRDVFGQQASLIVVDIDHFKWVNDNYGHPAGDTVLKAVADRTVQCFPRKSDLVARFGGEEFVIVLPDTAQDDAKRLADRLLEAIRGSDVQHEEQTIRVTASAGVAGIAREETAEQWLARADKALYHAKEAGRDRTRVAE
ncbi:MAG: GGDEF domain-containing protein [Chloroflexota bacterium]